MNRTSALLLDKGCEVHGRVRRVAIEDLDHALHTCPELVAEMVNGDFKLLQVHPGAISVGLRRGA